MIWSELARVLSVVLVVVVVAAVVVLCVYNGRQVCSTGFAGEGWRVQIAGHNTHCRVSRS